MIYSTLISYYKLNMIGYETTQLLHDNGVIQNIIYC